MFYEEEQISTHEPVEEEILGPVVIGPTTLLVIPDGSDESVADFEDPLEQLFSDLDLSHVEIEDPFETLASADLEVEPEKNDDRSSHLALARRALEQARDMINNVIELLDEDRVLEARETLVSSRRFQSVGHRRGHQAYEGVFDGLRMISADGSVFEVPPNYASKSRLVEGDLLKLAILPDGSHRYKQIGPAPRERIVGLLICDEIHGGYCLLASGNRYRLLDSSVSFYRGRPGDEVVALVPKDTSSRFAAVEMIVHKV